MSRAVRRESPRDERLTRDRVLRGAVEVADSGGLASLTIRSLAEKLGVKPMSVYHYVANKDEILDGIIDIVFSEIVLPVVGGDWRSEITRRAESALSVLRRHPWAILLLESRSSLRVPRTSPITTPCWAPCGRPVSPAR